MGLFFFKFTVYIVKIDKKQNPLKSTAENDSTLPQCTWFVCPTPELVCGGGDKGIETPCTYQQAKGKKLNVYYATTTQYQCFYLKGDLKDLPTDLL